MYYREPRSPSGAEAHLTEVGTRIAGLAIEHQAAREILARTQAHLAQATYAAATSEAVVSIVDDVSKQLEAVIGNADKCIELLNEDTPELPLLREPLKNIARDGRNALELLARTRPAKR
jgi:hypothetical protein